LLLLRLWERLEAGATAGGGQHEHGNTHTPDYGTR
jgi:hypothetical protein